MKDEKLRSIKSSINNTIQDIVISKNTLLESLSERTNAYIIASKSPEDNLIDEMVKLQKLIIKKQPDPMSKPVEGVDYLPAKRHVFKGIDIPLQQILKSIELEKKESMAYIICTVLPVNIPFEVIFEYLDDSLITEGITSPDELATILGSLLDQVTSFNFLKDLFLPLSKLDSVENNGGLNIDFPQGVEQSWTQFRIQTALYGFSLFDALFIQELPLIRDIAERSEPHYNFSGNRDDAGRITRVRMSKEFREHLRSLYVA